MTVREAFAKAGYPAPEESLIYLAFDEHYQEFDMIESDILGKVVSANALFWWYDAPKQYPHIAVFSDDHWDAYIGNMMSPVPCQRVDVSMAPAISMYKALPDALKPIAIPCPGGEPCLECLLQGVCLGLEDAKEFNS